MSYTPGEPVVGFTLNTDGDPRIIERLAGAVMREYEEIVAEEDALMRPIFGGGSLERHIGFERPLVNARMRIQFFTAHRDLSLGAST